MRRCLHDAHCVAWSNRKPTREWKASLATDVLRNGASSQGDRHRRDHASWSRPGRVSRKRRAVCARASKPCSIWARVRGYREGENPARWRGHLDHLLPDRKRIARVVHHRALPYRVIPGLVAKLCIRTEIEARALEFVLLTAARERSLPCRLERGGSRCRHLDRSGRAHEKSARAPRAARSAAIAILERTPKERRHGPVFPNGARRGKTVTVIALWRLAQELSGGATTVHGLRSSFRDWAGEQTSFAREIIELALAHVVGGDTELAYRRGDMLEKRRPLMEAWASYCIGAPARAAATHSIGSRARG